MDTYEQYYNDLYKKIVQIKCKEALMILDDIHQQKDQVGIYFEPINEMILYEYKKILTDGNLVTICNENKVSKFMLNSLLNVQLKLRQLQ